MGTETGEKRDLTVVRMDDGAAQNVPEIKTPKHDVI